MMQSKCKQRNERLWFFSARPAKERLLANERTTERVSRNEGRAAFTRTKEEKRGGTRKTKTENQGESRDLRDMQSSLNKLASIRSRKRHDLQPGPTPLRQIYRPIRISRTPAPTFASSLAHTLPDPPPRPSCPCCTAIGG